VTLTVAEAITPESASVTDRAGDSAPPSSTLNVNVLEVVGASPSWRYLTASSALS
jgi:hypothetical protein